MNFLHAQQEYLAKYRTGHTTLGCRIMHMIGIPMIMASFIAGYHNLLIGVGLFVIGWTLQFLGHTVFEKNSPLFLSDPLNPLSYTTAVIFIAQEYGQLLLGKWR